MAHSNNTRRRSLVLLLVVLALGSAFAWHSVAQNAAQSVAQSAAQTEKQPVGYTDTPQIPGQPWKVHDPDRPQPEVVTPGSSFSHGAAPPSDAVVLFDGTSLDAWQGSGGPAAWKVENGYMEVTPTGSIRTKQEFGDFQLHLEWATPAEVVSNSQGRGNSGVMIYGLYEVQVLDSYQNRTYPDGQAASLYGQRPPLANASSPPGEWQTYDILFEGPRWEGEELVRPASVTVLHNGVAVHHKMAYRSPSLHRRVGSYDTPHPPRGFIGLQDHRNPVRYRNVWIRELGDYDE